MVSFSCEACGDVLTKGKLDKHTQRCRNASFTCIDCMTCFHGASYRQHTSCMTEDQKYQGALYKPKERKGRNNNQNNNSQTNTQTNTQMIPRKAYVEDEAGDTEMGDAAAVAVVQVPPRAPSPPTPDTNAARSQINVFDYLVDGQGTGQPGRPDSHLLDTQASEVSDDSHFARHGYSYGNAPIQPSVHHHQSYSSLVPHAGSQAGDTSQEFVTPGPSRTRFDLGDDRKSSDKKRKRREDRGETESDRKPHRESRPPLHSGLTGGLVRLLGLPTDDDKERGDHGRSPLSPKKRSRGDDAPRERNGDHDGEEKRRQRRDRRRDSTSSEEDGRPVKVKAIEYPGSTARAAAHDSQMIQHRNPGELFLGLVSKGPESDRGMSINKVLKRYHRERGPDADRDKDTNDKDLWKDLRLRRNERGEIVLFMQ